MMNNRQNSWQNDFGKLTLQEITRGSPQTDHSFQHRIMERSDHKDNNSISSEYENPVSLRYRDSISSTTSSLSRNSTVSSSGSSCFSMNSPPLSRATSSHIHPAAQSQYKSSDPYNSPQQLSPTNIHSPEMYHQPYQSFSQPLTNTIDPNGCFVPCKPLPLVQKNDTTRNHFVVPTFSMIGQNQADVMRLLFNYTDTKPFEPKEELERTLSWNVDQNSSLITVSQYTGSGLEAPVTRNYLVGLGQRLGITSIVIIVSIEAIHNIFPLLTNLTKAIEIDTNPIRLMQKDQASWWSRVILVVNQQQGISPQSAYSQRKSFLVNDMPRIQETYGLSQPLSTLFLSTQVYDQLVNTEKGLSYKQRCQRILWQMMQNHTLCGRWCSEISSIQNRMNSINSTTINILTEDDESSSSEDEEDGMPKIINYVDYKVVKSIPKKKTLAPLQRRPTRRLAQKLHCHDGDDGTTLPTPIRNL